MMYCTHCKKALPDEARFCPYCGTAVEIQETQVVEEVVIEDKQESVIEPIVEPVVAEKTEPAEDIPVQEIVTEEKQGSEIYQDAQEIPSEDIELTLDDDEPEQPKIWYYVKDNQSIGPNTVEEMKECIESQLIDENTLVWKSGMADWAKLSETDLKDYLKKKAEESKNSMEEWFFIDSKNEQNGPFSTNQMIEMIKNHTIFGNTFVWRSGMADWKRLKDTELAIHAASENTSSHGQPRFQQPNYQQTSFYQSSYTVDPDRLYIENRSIGMAIVLTIVTCGIYSLYWLYCMARDVNACCDAANCPRLADPGMVLLLDIVTCGFYGIYYYWKVGKTLNQLDFPSGYKVSDNSILLLVMPIRGLGIISMAIIQSSLNDINVYGRQ